MFSSSDSFARWASSTRITAKTIDARPRGPNQPRKATVGRLAPDPSIARTDGKHANERQAEKRIQDDLGGDVVEHGHEHDGAEEDERDCPEQAACLLEQECHLASDVATEPAEDGASDERRDEPAAAHPYGQAVGERSPGNRYDLNPVLIHEAAWDAHPDHCCGRETRNHAPEGSVPDLLEHELHCRTVSDRALLRLGDRDRDQEERHADAVVQPALDVEPLTHAGRNAGIGDDRLPQCSVGRGEHDREQDGLDQHELAKQCNTCESAGHDGQRQPDREQAKRHDVLASQHCEVDP